MKELRATAYSVGATFTIVATPSCTCRGSLNTLCNGECFRLITCLPFPAVTTLVPVYIQINGVNYPVMDEFGNTLMSDQIRCRRAYRIVFGTNPEHFIVKQCLKPSQATPTCTGTTTTSIASTGAKEYPLKEV